MLFTYTHCINPLNTGERLNKSTNIRRIRNLNKQKHSFLYFNGNY